jgi:hypothetical protein
MANPQKSRAARVLEDIDGMEAPAAVDALPGDVTVAPDQPTDNDTQVPALQDLVEAMEQDPGLMGQACDKMADLAERYCDEGDQATFTADPELIPQVKEACGQMREAAKVLRRAR